MVWLRVMVAALAWPVARTEDLLAAPEPRPKGTIARTVRKGGAVLNYYERPPKKVLTAAERQEIDWEVANRTLRASKFVLERVAAPRIELTKADVGYLSHFVYVDEVHRLLFAAVPKAACSEFMRLVHRLRNDTDWFGKNPHFRGDRPLLSQMSPEAATRVLNDPTWTKVVFFRDPAARLLSAYLDKFVLGNSYSTKVFHKEKKLKFDEFVDLATSPNKNRSIPLGLHFGTNPHWRPQRYLSNMEKLLPVFNFVGAYEHLTLHAEMLLRSLGLWDVYGASGWWRKGRRYKADSIFAANGAKHRTKHKRSQSQYYTPALLAKVKAAYKMDYDMLDAIGYGTEYPTTGTNWLRTPREARFDSCRIAPALCDASRPEAEGKRPELEPPNALPTRREVMRHDAAAWVREILQVGRDLGVDI